MRSTPNRIWPCIRLMTPPTTSSTATIHSRNPIAGNFPRTEARKRGPRSVHGHGTNRTRRADQRIAQRIPRTSAWPPSGTAVASATGTRGSQSARRAQPGSNATAFADSTAVGKPYQHRQRRGEDQEARGGAGLGRAAQLRAVGIQARVQLRHRHRRIRHPESACDVRGVGDVVVGFVSVQRAEAEALVRAQEAVDLGHVHPLQQVRVVGASTAARPAQFRARGRGSSAPGRPRPARRPRCRTSWWPERCWCAAAVPTGRPCTRSARRRRPSRADGATAATGRAVRRRTWRHRRAPAGSGCPRRTSAARACRESARVVRDPRRPRPARRCSPRRWPADRPVVPSP